MEANLIFSEEFLKRLPKLNRWSNPYVVYLAKSDKDHIVKHRQQLEKWYRNIPQEHRKDLVRRLHSVKRNEQHLAAVYELVWHQYLFEEGWTIEIHPEIEGVDKHPDFLVTTNEKDPFCLEVATVFESRSRLASEKRFNDLLVLLEEVKGPFYVIATEKTSLPESFLPHKEGKKIKYFLTQELNKIDPSSALKEPPIRLDYKDGDICLGFAVFPRPEGEDSVIHGTVPSGYWGDAQDKLKTAISKKRKKYKGIKEKGIPFVLAICSSGHSTVSIDALESALFGQPKLTFELGNADASTWSRDFSGLLSPRMEFQKPPNTRLSAIIFCERKLSDNGSLYDMRVYHNPWALNPLPEYIFEKLPQLTVKSKDGKPVGLKWTFEKLGYMIAFED